MDSQSSEYPSGTILLGKYELGRRLGIGSFAKVHVARCIQTGELVAVKIIDKKKTANARMEPRIIREVEAMRRLQHHPNVLKIHEVMATKTKIYLVMELAAGGELYERIIRSSLLSEATARRYFQQLISALSFCHSEGITHRDVKPQNLLLDNHDNLKLSDFGLTALSEHRGVDGLLRTACGTPAFTAPEVIAQKPYDGAKADAWSCGVFLFVLLSGCVPFDDTNIMSMYRMIQRRDYRFPNSIPKPARAIIFKLLDPNPNTRMSIEAVTETRWFQKSLETRTELVESCNVVLETEPKKTVNAFDLIGILASGLDLSAMFEKNMRKEMRFTARVSAEGVVEKAKEIREKLGFRVVRVEKKKEGAKAVGLGKGRTMVVVEAVDVAEGLVVAEVKVAEGKEEEEEKEEACLFEVAVELEEIALAWH